MKKDRKELSGAEIVQTLSELLESRFGVLDKRITKVEVLLEKVSDDLWKAHDASKLRDEGLHLEIEAVGHKVKNIERTYLDLNSRIGELEHKLKR
jgi:hypothetical protein